MTIQLAGDGANTGAAGQISAGTTNTNYAGPLDGHVTIDATGAGGGTYTGALGWNNVRIGTTDQGMLTIQGGATVEVDDTLGGGAYSYQSVLAGQGIGSEGTINVDGAGTSLTSKGITGGVRIGREGSGILNITNGAEVKSFYLDTAREATASATVNIDGAGSRLLLSSNYGDFISPDFPNSYGGFMRVGREAGSSGVVNVTNGGLLELENVAGVSDAGALSIARNDGSYGRVNVDGVGSEVRLTQASVVGDDNTYAMQLRIGRAGQGIVEVSNDAKLDLSGDGTSINVGSGTGSAVVDPQSELRILSGADVVVDARGFPTSAFNVDGGAVIVGRDALGSGKITVDGFGSTLETLGGMGTGGGITVGRYGNGELEILGGAEVSATTYGYLYDPTPAMPDSGDEQTRGGYQGLSVGHRAGATGTATVSGAGSKFTAYGDGNRINIGREGTGTLNVANGGEVSSLQLEVGRTASGIGTVTIDGANAAIRLTDTTGNFIDPQYAGEAAFARFGREAGSKGYLSITNGGLFSMENTDGQTDSPILQVARLDGSYGRIDVTGTGSKLEVIQNGAQGDDYSGGARLLVGRQGQGILNVSNNGVVNVLGDDSALGVGAAVPFGSGVIDALADPTSEINITSGGFVSVDAGANDGGYLILGVGANGRASMLVDGAGSTFLAAGNYATIEVGEDGGAGYLTISNGGTVTNSSTNGETFIGRNGGFGSLTVDGSGSTLNAGPRLTVAASLAGGELIITNGGTVNAGDIDFAPGGSKLEAGAGTINVGAGGLLDLDTVDEARFTPGVLQLSGDFEMSGTDLVFEIAADGLTSGKLLQNGSVFTVGSGNSLEIVAGTYQFTAGDTYTLFESNATSYDSFFPIDASDVSVVDQNQSNLPGFSYALVEKLGAVSTFDFLALNNGDGSGAKLLDLGAVVGTSSTFTYDANLGGGDGGSVAGDVNVAAIGIDQIAGTTGADVLSVNGNVDFMLSGMGGNDSLIGGEGDDVLDGGGGSDTAVYFGALGDYGFGLDGSGNLTITDTTGLAGTDTLTSIETLVIDAVNYNVRAGTDAVETIVGTAAHDIILGFAGDDYLLDVGGGDDVLFGEGGDDQMQGSQGADTYDGGTGIDEVRYNNSDGLVVVDLATGTGLGGHAQGDTFSFVENIVGSQFGDTLIGDENANRLEGYFGDDMLIGGFGADVLFGGLGFDTADFSGSTASVDIGLFRIGTGGTSQGDELIGVEAIIGSSFADTLVGAGAFPVIQLDGGAGNDLLFDYGGVGILNGGDDNDTLIGRLGADAHDGGDGIDVARFASAVGAVTIDLAAGTGTGADAQGDTFVNVENVVGSRFFDTLTGDGEDNRLEGLAGRDRLTGGEGDDLLFGGADLDTFVFTTGNWGNDTIFDFDANPGREKMDMSAIGIGFADLSFVDTAFGMRIDFAHPTFGMQTIALGGVDLADITIDDFIF